MATLSDIVGLLEGWYPPDTADEHDAVGLVHGDPGQAVGKVLFAVDPTIEVAQEAASWGADLLVVHHPLFLRGVHGFAETTPKGRTLATLVRAGCALFTAHTNADRAEPGVSDAMATALGLTNVRPLRAEGTPLDKLTVYVPEADAERVRGALSEAGAGRIGDYESASFTSPGEGRFRPLEGARPAVGRVGDLEVVGEARIEVVLDRRRRAEVIAAMLVAHPYETPAWDIVELADGGTASTGAGRVGDVEPTTLRDFSAYVATSLPQTVRGVLVSGDPDRVVRRVAVAGGAGDFLLGDALGSGADVFVTSDLRHHPATEFVEKGGPALVDVAHWAAEWTWLPHVEARLVAGSRYGGDPREHPVHRRLDVPRLIRGDTLKADPAAQLTLLDLQVLDSRADLLRYQRGTLPEHDDLAALTMTRRDLDDQARDARILVDDLTAEQTKVDADVEQVKTRRDRDRTRMDQGLVSNPKDLERMQHEMESLERRITSLEDEELEVMARLEDAQRSLDELTAQLADADARNAKLEEARDARYAEIDAELARLAEQRGPVAAGVPDDLTALYDRLRAAKNGVGAAALRARQCTGCMLSLDNAEVGKLRAAAEDEVLRCEECQRILVRTEESGL